MGAVAVRRICVLLLFGAVLAGCGSSKSSGTSSGHSTATTSTVPAVAEDASLAVEVPPAIKQAGTITVGSAASFPPTESLGSDGTTVVGLDPDLVNAIAKVLGLKTEFKNVPFTDVLDGVESGRFTVGASAITDTKEREKTVQFVTYLTAGEALLTKTDDPHITKLDEICGHRVAVEKGTVEEDNALEAAKACRARGQQKISLALFTSIEEANESLFNGRSEILYADAPMIEYEARTLGAKVSASPPFGNEPYGFALSQNSGLAEPMLEALKVLIKNGTYAAILKNWDLQGHAISEPVIDGALR